MKEALKKKASVYRIILSFSLLAGISMYIFLMSGTGDTPADISGFSLLSAQVSFRATALYQGLIYNAPVILAVFFVVLLLFTLIIVFIGSRVLKVSSVFSNAGKVPKEEACSGFVYKIPGLLSWFVIMACAAGIILAPRVMFFIALALMIIFIARLLFMSCFSIVALVKCRCWSKTDWEKDDEIPGDQAGFAPSDVYHIVVIPNYRESMKVLERTLDALSGQFRAASRIIPVLAMEEREEGACTKGEELAARYRSLFFRFIVTIHPENLPGELPCKAANVNYAARQASRIIVDEEGIYRDRITISVCDADSLFHPSYFAAVSRLFVHDEERYYRFWQAPVLFYNNIWKTYAPIRLMAYFAHTAQMGEMAVPRYNPLPISSYTLSLRLAEESGWWDPNVICEDWHVYLKKFFRTRGRVSLTPVYLPIRADAVDGVSFSSAMRNRYKQAIRHSWSAEDIGYYLNSWKLAGEIPGLQRLTRFIQLLIVQLLRSAGWFLVISCSVLALWMRQTGNIPPEFALFVPYMKFLYLGGLGSLFLIMAVEFLRFPPPLPILPAKLFSTVLSWVLLPLFSLYLVALPALRAHTMLLVGEPLGFRVTRRYFSSGERSIYK